MFKRVLKKIIASTLAISMFTTAFINIDYIKVKAAEKTGQEFSNFGVGEGIEWPKQVNAPFVDMTAYVNKPGYEHHGVTNLGKLVEDTGVKFYNLGFIQSVGNKVENGKIKWGWGGQPVITEDTIDPWQHDGIKQSIRDVREAGGDVTISLGGLIGTTFWEVTQDVDILYNTYMEIIKGYGLTRVDLDIEGPSAQNKEKNIANAKAIKKVQDETGVELILTLAVMPEGLTRFELDVLEAYLSNGVKIDVINIMTMCYGVGAIRPGENYGQASIRAMDNTKDQIKDYFNKFAGINLTDAEAYGKLGTTTSIGFESDAHPIFNVDMAKLVVDHSIEKGVSMTSLWSMNRDSMVQPNKGVTSQYEFTNVYKSFPFGGGNGGTEINTKPVILGANDKVIYVGDIFNEKDGVTATDKEDGDITNNLIIVGAVNTSKAGSYLLTYSITDSKGLTTKIDRVITVKEKISLEDNYDTNKVYNKGDEVIYLGVKYIAKWYVVGENPDSSPAWEVAPTINEDGSEEYIEGKAYTGGSLVKYNGRTYKAVYWTTSIPGSDTSWILVS